MASERTRSIIFFALVFAAAFWWMSHWYNGHKRKVQEDAAVRARNLKHEAQAKALVARLRSDYGADDAWEDLLFTEKGDAAPYVAQFQDVLMNGRPIIVYGTVDDIANTPSGFIVAIQDEGRHFDQGFKLSLQASPEIGSTLLEELGNDPIGKLNTVIFVVTVSEIERVHQAPDQQSGEDEDYILAHGSIQAACPTQMFGAPDK